MTHRHTFSLAGLLLAAAAAVPLTAQRPMPPQGGPPPAGAPQPGGRPQGGPPQGDARRGPPGIDERVQMMTADLALTPDQAAKVRTVFVAAQRTADSVVAKCVTEMDAERAAMQALHARTEQSLQGILTPEQRTKHLVMRARMERQGGMDGRGGRRGPPGGQGGQGEARRGPPPGGAPDRPDGR